MNRVSTGLLGTFLALFLASCSSGPQMPTSPLLDEDEPSCHEEMMTPTEKEL
jgi:hypothetical protein